MRREPATSPPPDSSTLLANLNRLRPLFSRADKKNYVILVLMMLVGAFLETLGIGMVPAFLKLLTDPDQIKGLPIISNHIPQELVDSPPTLFAWCIGLFVAFIIFKILYFAYYLRLKNRLTARHQIALSQRVFSAYINASWEFHLDKNSAELQRNVIGETIEIFNGIINPLLNISLGLAVTVLIFITNFALLPWDLLLFLLVFCVLSGIALNSFKHSLTRAGESARDARKSSIQSVNEGLATILDSRILGKESFLVSRLTKNISQFTLADRRRDYISKLFPHILEAIAVLGLLLMLWLLIHSADDFMDTLPTLSLVVASLVRLRQSMANVIGGFGQMHYSKLAIRNITDHLDNLEQQKSPTAAQTSSESNPISFEKEIRLKSLTYQYPRADAPSLQSIDLTIPHSQTVCLTGASGSGKSTAINLILGILQPETGEILVDGVPIQTNLKAWHQLIGYVPQTIHLLAGSIRSNVAFGVPDEDIDEEQLKLAIRMAQLEPFVAEQPDGLDAPIGEGGAKMSGGQRQRLGIARALYRRPKLLILDEGTSALDNATESTILQQLKQHEWPSTMIMISHRATSIRFCSNIFVFENGSIIANGDHDTLLRQCPAYAALLQEE